MEQTQYVMVKANFQRDKKILVLSSRNSLPTFRNIFAFFLIFQKWTKWRVQRSLNCAEITGRENGKKNKLVLSTVSENKN